MSPMEEGTPTAPLQLSNSPSNNILGKRFSFLDVFDFPKYYIHSLSYDNNIQIILIVLIQHFLNVFLVQKCSCLKIQFYKVLFQSSLYICLKETISRLFQKLTNSNETTCRVMVLNLKLCQNKKLRLSFACRKSWFHYYLW